jgi:hypothetical protein
MQHGKNHKNQKIQDPHIFNRILFRDKNEPINIMKKSEMAMNIVGGLKKNLEKAGTRQISHAQRAQLIKTKVKEEEFLSRLDNKEKQKFQVKKKLFELISPFDEDEKRLEEVMALANIKNLPNIFKFIDENRKRTNLFKNINLRKQSDLGAEGGENGETTREKISILAKMEQCHNSQDIKSTIMNIPKSCAVNSQYVNARLLSEKKSENLDELSSRGQENSNIQNFLLTPKNKISTKSILSSGGDTFYNKKFLNTGNFPNFQNSRNQQNLQNLQYQPSNEMPITPIITVNNLQNNQVIPKSNFESQSISQSSPQVLKNSFRSRNSSFNSPIINKQAFSKNFISNVSSLPISNVPTNYTHHINRTQSIFKLPSATLKVEEYEKRPQDSSKSIFQSAKLKQVRSQVRNLICYIEKEHTMQVRKSHYTSSKDSTEAILKKTKCIIPTPLFNMHNRNRSSFL